MNGTPPEPGPDATARIPSRDATVAERLWQEPYRFDFFQAVRMLERMYPDRAPVGRHGAPDREVVRFKAHVSMSFPASELYDLEARAADDPGPPTLRVTFMGLAGAAGVLPRHYTAMLADPAMRRQGTPAREFLDIFNHRLISLFYRAWEKYRFPVAYERGGADVFSNYLFCLVGMGFGTLRSRLRVSDQILLHYGGLLARRPRPAVGLEGLLQDYFGVPIVVEQFAGQWFLTNPESLTSIGRLGQNHRLGVDAVLWERVFDPQARFRVKVGPLTLSQFRDFLPTGDAYRSLVELTRFYAGEEFSFDVQPVLEPDEVPWCVLGQPRTSHLGWAMWLRDGPLTDPPTQPVFQARTAHLDPEQAVGTV